MRKKKAALRPAGSKRRYEKKGELLTSHRYDHIPLLDFAAVRSVGTETRTTVRTVHYFQVQRSGDLIECKVCADGFLYNMVRAMVGTIVYAAEGKFSADSVADILLSKNRTAAGPTVPPGGLYMTRLWYQEDVL